MVLFCNKKNAIEIICMASSEKIAKVKLSSLVQWVLYIILFGLSFLYSDDKSLAGGSLVGRVEQLVVGLIFLYLLFCRVREGRFRLSFFNLSVSAFLLWILLMSISTGNQPFPWFYRCVCVWCVLLCAKLFWTKNAVQSFYILSRIGSFLVYFNAILVVLFPDGLYTSEWGSSYFLFGNYNATGAICLLCVLFQGVYTTLTGKGENNLLLLTFVSFAVCLFLGSMTSTVGLVIAFVYTLFRNYITHLRPIVITFIVVLVLFMFVVVIAGNSIEDYPIIIAFIENVLGKDSSFTARTYVWFVNLDYVSERPWLGWGFIDSRIIEESSGAIGTHNLFIAVALYGGIVAICFFINALRHALLAEKHNSNTTTRYTLTILCIFLLMSLFEQYNWIVVFGITIVTYYSQWFSDNEIKSTDDNEFNL